MGIFYQIGLDSIHIHTISHSKLGVQITNRSTGWRGFTFTITNLIVVQLSKTTKTQAKSLNFFFVIKSSRPNSSDICQVFYRWGTNFRHFSTFPWLLSLLHRFTPEFQHKVELQVPIILCVEPDTEECTYSLILRDFSKPVANIKFRQLSIIFRHNHSAHHT